MSHARIEEVSDSDSDPSEAALSDLDEDDFDEREILKARPSTSVTKSLGTSSQNQPNPQPKNSQFAPQLTPDENGTQFQSATDEAKYKSFQCIYPVYFDKNRSRAQGRRVGLENAVDNPLAREIVDACGRLRLETLFEPAKLHPKDWSNPGRVKVRIKAGDGVVKNKHHLYTLISTHLKSHPTTEATAIKVRVPGAPTPDASKPYPKPAVPKGWKMGTILPYYSPAMTGGGVSENFFKDMMAEMQGMQGVPGAAGQMPALDSVASGGVDGKKKKEKKKIKG